MHAFLIALLLLNADFQNRGSQKNAYQLVEEVSVTPANPSAGSGQALRLAQDGRWGPEIGLNHTQRRMDPSFRWNDGLGLLTSVFL